MPFQFVKLPVLPPAELVEELNLFLRGPSSIQIGAVRQKQKLAHE